MRFAKKAILISFFATLPFITVLAQHENIPLVTVVGESVVKAKPDYVIIGLKIVLPFNKSEIKPQTYFY